MIVGQWHRPTWIVRIDALRVSDDEPQRSILVNNSETPSGLVFYLGNEFAENVKGISHHVIVPGKKHLIIIGRAPLGPA
jgi:hypothetical protein